MSEPLNVELMEAAVALMRHADSFYWEVIELDGKISVEKDNSRVADLKSACGQALARTGLAYFSAHRALCAVAEFDKTELVSIDAAKERGIECLGAKLFKNPDCLLGNIPEEVRHKLYKAWDKKVPKGRM